MSNRVTTRKNTKMTEIELNGLLLLKYAEKLKPSLEDNLIRKKVREVHAELNIGEQWTKDLTSMGDEFKQKLLAMCRKKFSKVDYEESNGIMRCSK